MSSRHRESAINVKYSPNSRSRDEFCSDLQNFVKIPQPSRWLPQGKSEHFKIPEENMGAQQEWVFTFGTRPAIAPIILKKPTRRRLKMG